MYYGCYREPGHHLWGPGMERVDVPELPWPELDRELAPPRARPGEVALHHKDGWTALAFWDRSIDQQPGANSVFLIPEELDFDAAKALVSEAFPAVWEQLTCVVRLPGGRRKVRNTVHAPPGWFVEEAFAARGPEGEESYHPTREDAVIACWDIYQPEPKGSPSNG